MDSPVLFKPVVVCPTYNNAGTPMDVLARVEAQELPIFVVNDGSTDDTPRLLEQWLSAEHALPVQVLRHEVNRGKAQALQTGFAAALAQGYTHAITLDTDGQHDPEDLPKLVDASREKPYALVLGWRDEAIEGYPMRSQLGRRLSNLCIRLECGARVRDSQTGFRVYPLALIEAVSCRSGHFGFESEIITRAAWAGCPIEQVPVNSRYFRAEQRVSHFRPVLDSARAVGMHLRLMLRELAPIPHRVRWPGEAVIGTERSMSWWRAFWHWISPQRVWRELQNDQIGRFSLAAGLALGAFIANMPIYPLQTLACLYVARRLHLHPLTVVAGSFISTPPLGPILIVAGIFVGHLVLHGAPPDLTAFDPSELSLLNKETWRAQGQIYFEWTVGALIVGLACMSAMFVGALTLLGLSRPTPPASAG